MIAEARAGNGDAAHDYYSRINPSARREISDLHRCEPYVYAQMIAGKDAADPRGSEELVAHGDGRLELLRHHPMDSRNWPHYDGLEISPVLPKDWILLFRAIRKFRGVTYHIDIECTGDGNKVSLEIDGAAINGDLVPLPAPNTKTVSVKATLR